MKTQNKIHPKLTLVGAGPGDPDLISVKGVAALGKADVVLYDALVNTELLKYAPVHVPKIFVGKRKGRHEYSQEQINALIADFSFTYGNVVRLKGGDPFVFGRGLEEIEYAEVFNIETEIIPGISSSIGVPGLQGIPVTHRGASESFWVITGTTSSGKLSHDVKLAAQTNATVVILMGVSKLGEIAEIYKKANKHEVPVAIIQNGSLPNENIALGTVNTINDSAREEKIGSPAVIVIGEVVRHHKQFAAKTLQKELLLN
jgi:uroporphyrin-III C-methyltransferase